MGILRDNGVRTLTIESGVTLLVPYGNTSSDRNTSGEATIHYEGSKGKSYYTANTSQEAVFERISHVILCEGVSLYVNGTLEISGELTGAAGGSPAGHTAGKYSELILEPNANIFVDGEIKAYGFISNSSESANQNTLVTVNGTIFQPFSLVDYKGGSLLKAINDQLSTYKYHPFCQFRFMNISVETKYNYTGKLKGWCNLATGKLIGDGMQQNFKEVTFIGKGYMIELTDSNYSFIMSKYDPSTQITDLRIYGGAKNNPMSLSISTGLGDVNTSSDKYFFGISWYYNITLDNAPNQASTAEFVMPYSYKMMPGSKLTIENGARLTINTLSIYESFVDEIYNTENGSRPGIYPSVYPSSSSLSGQTITQALLIVRGSLVADYLGGNVYSDRNGATLIAKYGTIVETFEPCNYHGSILDCKIDTNKKITEKLRLIYFVDDDENGEVKSNEITCDYIGLTGITYETYNNAWRPNAQTSYIEVNLPDGVRAVVSERIIVNSDGTLTFTMYDSEVGETIKVIEGTPIMFYLAAGQVVTEQDELSLTLDELSALYDDNRAPFTWNASSNGAPSIYTGIPKVTLTDNGDSTITSIKVKNIKTNPSVEIIVSETKTGSAYLFGTAKATASIGVTLSSSEHVTITYTCEGTDKTSGNIYTAETTKRAGISTTTVTATVTVTITISAGNDNTSVTIS